MPPRPIRLPPHLAERIVRWLAVLFFLGLVARFWHPAYGFTRLLMMDTASQVASVPELRDAPLFTYDDGYDGHYYAQLAARPLANDPVLTGSIDNISYRARRILLSWAAWCVGFGDPVASVRAYAWLNLVAWCALAAVLWRIFPPGDSRSTIAWAGVLFSAGVLGSVRLALTDLTALLLATGTVLFVLRGRLGGAAGLLGLVGLTRETAMLGAIALWPTEKVGWRLWLRAAVLTALAAAPLLLWMFYLRHAPGATDPGLANFTLPVAGWLEKWAEVIHRFRDEPDRYLALTTLLAHLALSVQFVYLACRPQLRDVWWRLGAIYGLLMLCLSGAVWLGHPGAALRVLLPMTLAFNVCAVRSKAAVVWLVAGNLSVLSGVLALWHVPHDPREVGAGHAAGASYVIKTDAHWFSAEQNRGRTWAWCGQDGGLRVKSWPQNDRVATVRLALVAFTPGTMEIREDNRVLWRGPIGKRLQWVELPAVSLVAGNAQLQLHSDAAPQSESSGPNARALGFAIYGAEVR